MSPLQAPESTSSEPLLPPVALALGQLILAINEARSTQELFASVARDVGKVLQADRASVVLSRDDDDAFEVFGLDGVHGAIPVGKRLPLAGTSVGRAVAARAALLWQPTATSPWLEGPPLAAEGLRSVINAPLVTDRQVLGCLNVASRDGAAYGAMHVELMTQLASLVASSLERIGLLARAETDLARQRDHILKLEGVSEIARLLSATTSEDQVVAATSSRAAAAFAAARASIAFLRSDGHTFEVRQASGRAGDVAIPRTFEFADAPLRDVLAAPGPSVFDDLASSSWSRHRELASHGICSVVSCPLFVSGRPVGVMNLGFGQPVGHQPYLVAVVGALGRVVGAALERVRAEETLRHAQKLESLGVLSGGLAHDFNNLLGAAIGHLSMAEATLAADQPAHQDVRHAREAMERCTSLTRQMLAYAGKGSLQVTQIDVNRDLVELARLLQGALAKNVQIHFDLSPASPTIRGDATQFQQAVLNLVTNAADAMEPRGGAINLRTRLETLPQATPSRWLPGHTLAAGRYVVLECADTGPGISDEVLPRIFDPFFTTKPKGHGLGLSALLGLMRSHGGDLRVASSPAGARFDLLFPEAGATAAAAPAPRGLVLLVDDDEAMQRSTRRMLEHLSFSVMIAGDGRGAVDIFRREHARLSWVLMDQSMPNQSGSSAARTMAELAPVPIVLMTGYDREATLDTVADTVRTVLAKPFGLKDLRALIDRLALGQA